MYIAYILIIDLFNVTPLLIFFCFWQKGGEHCFVFYFNPFVDDWQKGGERFWVYICIYVFLYLTINNNIWEKWFWEFKQKGGESFFWKICLIYACFSLLDDTYICLVSCASLNTFIYCDAWVKGEFLWSFTLSHAYITPWVLSSSKRERLLAQRPSTLVLMMINSCSYVY